MREEEGAVSPCSQPDPWAWEDAECLRFPVSVGKESSGCPAVDRRVWVSGPPAFAFAFSPGFAAFPWWKAKGGTLGAVARPLSNDRAEQEGRGKPRALLSRPPPPTKGSGLWPRWAAVSRGSPQPGLAQESKLWVMSPPVAWFAQRESAGPAGAETRPRTEILSEDRGERFWTPQWEVQPVLAQL